MSRRVKRCTTPLCNKLHIMLNVKIFLRKCITRTNVVSLALLPVQHGYGQLGPKPTVAKTKFGHTNFRQEPSLAKRTLAKPTFLANLTRISVLMFGPISVSGKCWDCPDSVLPPRLLPLLPSPSPSRAPPPQDRPPQEALPRAPFPQDPTPRPPFPLAALTRTAQNFALFFPSPTTIFIRSSLSGGSSRGILVV